MLGDIRRMSRSRTVADGLLVNISEGWSIIGGTRSLGTIAGSSVEGPGVRSP